LRGQAIIFIDLQLQLVFDNDEIDKEPFLAKPLSSVINKTGMATGIERDLFQHRRQMIFKI
jgi:hypothetical protein